jgi:hypothetical protein
MGVGYEIQNAPSPRPVDAREQHVAIQSTAVALFLAYAEFARIHFEIGSRSALACCPGGDRDFGESSAEIRSFSMQSSVHIHFFNCLKVHEPQTPNARASQCFSND